MAKRTTTFRQEALDHHNVRRETESRVLRLRPAWIQPTYWLLLAAVGCGVVYAVAGSVHEYASGPAVVRVQDRADLTARLGGTVSTVYVRPGQHVPEGELLVQFFGDEQQAEADRIDAELELELLKILRNPADQAARQQLSSLRAQRELVERRIGELQVRAPRAGIVSDVRVRPGQHLAVGELVVTVVDENARISLVALLPGRYRPMLRAGMPLRFELAGYRYEFHDLVIDSVGDEIIGPNEARRFLGPDIGDGVSIQEPVVVVSAKLPSPLFSSDGQSFHYFDGLPALAQVRARSQSIAVSLIPALRSVVRHAR